MLLPLASCAKQEIPAPVSAETGTSVTDPAVAAYLEKLHSGAYQDLELFAYEDLSQYFKLGDYKGLHYPDDEYLDTAVTDEEVYDNLVVAVLSSVVPDSDYTHLTQGVVEKYDAVHLSYEGVVDGKVLESATTGAQGADLIIGSGNYIPGFEAGLLGKAIGSTVTLSLRFSPYYADETVSGKPVRFTVHIQSVQRPKIPEVTADLINQIYGTDFSDLDSVQAALKEELVRERADRAQSSLAAYLQDRILENSTVLAYPEKEMQHYRDHFQAYFQQYADSQEKTLEDYLTGQGYDLAEFEEMKEEYAKTSCEADLLIFSIARAENVKAGDDQVEALILGLKENNQNFPAVEDLIEYYNSVYGPYYFENRILSAAVMELVEKNAVKDPAAS